MLLSKLIILEHVDSTNNYVANLLKDGKIEHGTAILSYNQQQGKGQRGSIWQSEPDKNIAISYFVNIHQEISSQPYLGYAVALSVYDLLLDFGIEAQIKWPNDILVDNRKICGILIQNQLSGKSWASSIIGIGINGNQHYEEEKALSAISLYDILLREVNLNEVVQRLTEKLDIRFQQFNFQQFAQLKNEFLHQMWQRGNVVDAEIGGKRVLVKILGVDENGLLKLEQDKKVTSYGLKEVKFFYQ